MFHILDAETWQFLAGQEQGQNYAKIGKGKPEMKKL